ncbi:hypothetical protein N0V93_007059 [Gnomoniopsis smithogilvyi]|uniref:Subtilisin-like protease n=1 Tax=Gnomoniopsis smithogilvyi TaxID=1191159 RepID=A0A9W8YPD4_9PEZI|nr:hypothetical protein N0V93_007059 [Gnomoniopsis smithogilvyi]
MAKSTLLFLLTGLLATEATAAAFGARTYIVQMKTSTTANRLARRQASLAAASVDAGALVYNYDTVLDGFAATITDGQAAALREQPDVLAVVPDGIKKLDTTHTPEFLDIDAASLDATTYVGASNTTAEADVIIGVLDTGAWPESASYDDTGLPSPPSSWAGICEEGQEWTASACNNKLIGARAFYKGLEASLAAENQTYNWTAEYKSARDADGHGTHTSTTVAGAEVPDVSLYGQAAGTARGVAVGARLAIYKVCYKDVGCYDSDILAAMDTAIKDGVNVISMSLGGAPAIGSAEGFDSISTGSYAATAAGVLVSCSAGNSGPGAGTVANNAPWIMTVGASTLDRDFPASILLSNGARFEGTSLYTNISAPDVDPVATQSRTPLVLSSAVATAGVNASDAELCIAGTLDPALVAGKVVLCQRGSNARVAKGLVVRDAGGLGMVLVNDEASGESLIGDAHVLPAVALGYSALAPLTEYITTSGNASVLLEFGGTVFGAPAPQMAGFSSRGPNFPAPDILKPDITGPGVNILAAWSDISPTGLEGDSRVVQYNIISGTSMSCPHLSGTAAWVMARRPTWSIAAIKSALMTTAYPTLKGSESPIIDGADSQAATVFDYGNGHVDPVAALDPGLVYDIQPTDYLDFLCAFNYTDAQIQTISRDNFTCDPAAEYSLYDLNYPSFAVWYNTNTTQGEKTVTFNRNVTNVGGASTYTVDVAVEDSSKVKVEVNPQTLTFGETGEAQSYSVTVTLSDPQLGSDSSAYLLSSARLTWSDGAHTVASSMGLYWGAPDSVGFRDNTTSLGLI